MTDKQPTVQPAPLHKPRMLQWLTKYHAEVTFDNEWEAQFIENLNIQYEENPEYRLTGKQFNKLIEIYERWRIRIATDNKGYDDAIR